MLSKNYNVLVTGGAGFIGSALCRYLMNKEFGNLIILDKLTYASDLSSLEKIIKNKNVFFYKGSIGNKKLINSIFMNHKPQKIYNLAAETHVDNSINNPYSFIKTNIIDTHEFIHTSLLYFQSLNNNQSKNFKFLQISTDEVYGDIELFADPVTEEANYNPSSPYSASKAAGDLLIKAYNRTYNFPGIISNCSNNYGPFQNEEKFIPVILHKLFKKEKIPIYGNGNQIRDWLYVDDHCDALFNIMNYGKIGTNYNIGCENEITNISLIKTILNVLKEKSILTEDDLDIHVKFVKDRLGHDKRYAINSNKIRSECKWQPTIEFNEGLEKTISFYFNKFLN